MNLPPFELEEFWKKHEFSTPYLLCCSDPESWSLQSLLELADPECLTLWKNLSLGYTEVPGLPLLRKEISNLYKKISDDEVFTFAGAEEGIYCSMRALIEPGDHVITIDPCYQSLKTLPKAFGAEVSSISLSQETHWELTAEMIESELRDNTKLIVLNYPHNPTGSLLTKETLNQIIKLAKDRDAYIFCDEVYRYLEYHLDTRLPSIADVYEKGISLNVLSKSFGMPGVRIGWIATRDKSIYEKISSYKLYTTICNSAPSEILALMALRAKNQILESNRALIKKNLSILDDFMRKYQNIFSWEKPAAGTIALIQFKSSISIETFSQDLASKAGVLIMPESAMGLTGNYFRIGFGRKNFPQILKKFENYLAKYTNKKEIL